MGSVLEQIASREGMTLSGNRVNSIIRQSRRNLRNAIILLQNEYIDDKRKRPYVENWKHSIQKNIVGKKDCEK